MSDAAVGVDKVELACSARASEATVSAPGFTSVVELVGVVATALETELSTTDAPFSDVFRALPAALFCPSGDAEKALELSATVSKILATCADGS